MESVVDKGNNSVAWEAVIEARFNGCSIPIKNFVLDLIKAKTIREKKLREQRFTEDFGILCSAQSIGADYYEASGQMPDEDVLRALHQNGYAPPPEDYIACIFYDLEDYHAHILVETEDRANEALEKEKDSQAERQKVLAEIERKAATGTLPFLLFAPFTREKSAPSVRGNDIAELCHDPISDTEKLRRYAKYQVACALVGEREDMIRHQDINYRRLSIALGVNVETGKILNHSFIFEILGGNEDFKTKEDVTESKIYEKWEHIIYPPKVKKEREQYLKEVLSAGQQT